METGRPMWQITLAKCQVKSEQDSSDLEVKLGAHNSQLMLYNMTGNDLATEDMEEQESDDEIPLDE